MPAMKPYPTLGSNDKPALSSAHSRHPIADWYYRRGRRTRVRIPGNIWAAAGVDIAAVEPRAATVGHQVLIVWHGPLWESLGPDARLAQEVGGLALSVTRAPTLDVKAGQLLIGEGYVVLVPGADTAVYEAIPVLERYAGQLTEVSIAKVDAPLPRTKALGFKQYTVIPVRNRACRFVDIHGLVWDAAGLKQGDGLLVTRFQDGVRITKAPGATNDGFLATKLQKGKPPYAHKRFGETVLGNVRQKTVRVVFTEDALFVLGDDVLLRDFGLTKKSQIWWTVPMKGGEFKKPAKRLRNFAVYGLRRQEPRIQVQGEWLAQFGFEPGVRFTLEDHPLIRGRLLARIDDKGEHKVTQHRPGQPGGKLYVPTRLLKHFKSEHVRVSGNAEGLHVQQHFATSSSSA